MNLMLAAISGNSLVMALVWVIVAAALWYLLNWAITASGVGDPFAKIGKIIVILAVVVLIVNALLLLVGRPLF